MSRRVRPRGYSLLVVMAVLTVIGTWTAITLSSAQTDSKLQRQRERRAVAERLAELGLQACGRGETPADWVSVGAAGQFRAQVQGNGCVGEGRVLARRGMPELTQRLARPR